MKIYKEVQILWPDTKQIEDGLILDDKDNQILFKSHFDNTINWVDKKYIL